MGWGTLELRIAQPPPVSRGTSLPRAGLPPSRREGGVQSPGTCPALSGLPASPLLRAAAAGGARGLLSGGASKRGSSISSRKRCQSFGVHSGEIYCQLFSGEERGWAHLLAAPVAPAKSMPRAGEPQGRDRGKEGSGRETNSRTKEAAAWKDTEKMCKS